MSAKEFDGVKRDASGSIGPVPQCNGVTTPPALPRLFLWKRDLCGMFGVGLRTLERMISSGEIPAPDRRLRGRPAWLARTIHEWAEGITRDGQNVH